MIDTGAEILTLRINSPQVTLESFIVRPIGRKINDEENKV